MCPSPLYWFINFIFDCLFCILNCNRIIWEGRWFWKCKTMNGLLACTMSRESVKKTNEGSCKPKIIVNHINCMTDNGTHNAWYTLGQSPFESRCLSIFFFFFFFSFQIFGLQFRASSMAISVRFFYIYFL